MSRGPPSSPPCPGSFSRIYNLRIRTGPCCARAPPPLRRAKGSVLDGACLLCCSLHIPPLWGAKRARSALSSSSQASPPRTGGSFRRIYIRRACSTAQAAPSREKRKIVSSQAGDCLFFCSTVAKRARTALCGTQISLFWGAKGARSALSGTLTPFLGPKPRARPPLLPVEPSWRDWTDLGEGPAGLIAERLLAGDIADYLSFRAVCGPWRHCCSTDPRKHGILDCRFHPRHWVMLRESGCTSYRRQFINIFTGHCRYLDLPELHGHDLFRTAEGLLVLLDRTTSVVRLLNPFTHQAVELPPTATLLTQRELELGIPMIRLLEVSGAGLADESTIAVHFGMIKTVAIAKPGDAHWTVVDRGSNICPAMSFAGRFYCATNEDIMVVETSANNPPRMTMVTELAGPLSAMMMDTVHLVENQGELMLVDRRRISNDTSKYDGNTSREYNVYRVDLDARKIVPVRGLGGHAIFIGIELALSVSPSVFPSISADAIYLGFDKMFTGWLDNSPIHLMDQTSEPREFDDSSSYGPLGIDDHLSWFVAGYNDVVF